MIPFDDVAMKTKVVKLNEMEMPYIYIYMQFIYHVLHVGMAR